MIITPCKSASDAHEIRYKAIPLHTCLSDAAQRVEWTNLLGVSRCSFKDSISAGPPPTHRSDVTYRVSMYHAQLHMLSKIQIGDMVQSTLNKTIKWIIFTC
jgi:hypothetical protein